MSAMGMASAENWVAQLGWALIHFLWQGTLIAGLYAIVRNRARQPQTRYLLGCCALLAMTAAPITTFFSDGPSGSVPTSETVSGTSQAASSAWSTTPVTSAVPAYRSRLNDIMPVLVMVWFAGAAGFWLRLAGGWMIAIHLMSSKPSYPAPPQWQRTLRKFRERIHISRKVKLLTSARVEVPTVIGWLRPVILMPIGALSGLPAEHVEALLAHELAHIRRHDYAINILQTIAEATLFYHPAVWWISNQVRNEREKCCDDIAVSVTGDAIIYAQALAGLETSRPASLSPVLAASGGSLEERIVRLLGGEHRTRLVSGATPAAVCVLAFSMAVAMLAQSTASRLAFEVASIKQSPPEYVGFQSYVRGDLYTALTATVRNLMAYAYGIRDFQISGGPGWTASSNYNISAKMDAGSSPQASKLMMQTLLADRFGLKFHRATKNRAGYALVIGKSGLKLVESKNPGPGLGLGRGRLNGRGADMRTLTRQLSSQLEAPIADRTGLNALYDFTLVWSPDIQVADATGPSIFSALEEQLGLRLEAVKKVPVEFFVIDSVRKPSED